MSEIRRSYGIQKNPILVLISVLQNAAYSADIHSLILKGMINNCCVQKPILSGAGDSHAINTKITTFTYIFT